MFGFIHIERDVVMKNFSKLWNFLIGFVFTFFFYILEFSNLVSGVQLKGHFKFCWFGLITKSNEFIFHSKNWDYSTVEDIRMLLKNFSNIVYFCWLSLKKILSIWMSNENQKSRTQLDEIHSHSPEWREILLLD